MDEGVYSCIATNPAGEEKQDVTVKVLGEKLVMGWGG